MNAQTEQKLLTIAIPTYNRAKDLKSCLSQLCKNLKGSEQLIELLVSDNNSTDDTEGVVGDFIAKGYRIIYKKNKENIGASKNFIQCFNMATAKYLWVMGDDDLLLNGYLNKIVEILKSGEYGVVHMRSYSYQEDYVAEKPKNTEFNYIIFDDNAKFIKKASHTLTFTSSNIVNRDMVDKTIDIDDFAYTNLPHLSWIFSALFSAQKNVYIDDFVVAGKPVAPNYALCEVFGKNINKIFEFFVGRGIKKENFDIINSSLAKNFFPKYILLSREKKVVYETESYFKMLHPILKKYMNFWIFTVPAIELPLFFVRSGYVLTKMVQKIRGR